MIREWETDRQTDKKRECFDSLLTWLSLQIEYSFLIAFNIFFDWSITLYLTYICITVSFLFSLGYTTYVWQTVNMTLVSILNIQQFY